MRLQEVVFCSQIDAVMMSSRPRWAMISVTGIIFSDVFFLGRWDHLLRVKFDDIDEPEEPYTHFTPAQAKEIVRFVRECEQQGIEGIVVHCMAGISRSAAIAKWIALAYSLSFPADYSKYNRLVYRLLREASYMPITESLRKVEFCSQPLAMIRAPVTAWAVISVTGCVSGEARLMRGWSRVLRVTFDDVEENEEPYLAFDLSMAQEIVRFVHQCERDGIEGILVHCFAGVSRSAAVAKWIAKAYGLLFPKKYSQYNKLVYRLLLEADTPPAKGNDND